MNKLSVQLNGDEQMHHIRDVDYPNLGLGEPGWVTVGSGPVYQAIEVGLDNPQRYFLGAGRWDLNGIWPMDPPYMALMVYSGAAYLVASDNVEGIGSVYGGFQHILLAPEFIVLWNFAEAAVVAKNGLITQVPGDLLEIESVDIVGKEITITSYEPGPMIRKSQTISFDEPKVSDKH